MRVNDIYIWGAGHYGVLTALDLEKGGIKIKGFIDINASQIKTRLGLSVLDLQAVLSNKPEKPKIIIAVQNESAWQVIVQDLLQAGFKKDTDFEFSHILPQIKTLPSLASLNNFQTEQIQWDEKPNTGYDKIDFTDVEFFEENILTNIEKFLFGNIEGTNYFKSEMSYKDRTFLNGIIRKTKPKTIVEMGVSAGGSSCVILNAIRDMENAKLYSFDYNTTWYREIGQNNGRKTAFLVEQTLPELMSKWELHTGGVPSKYFDKHLPKDGVDICLIDTVHRNPGEHLNILEILPFMKKNGIIIYHDTAYHCLHHAIGTTSCISINSLQGKQILLKSEKTMGLPNIGAIILDNDVEDMFFALFSNLSLPWHYKVTNDDFIEMFKHFLKYYPMDLVKIYVYYCYFYINGGLQNKDFATYIAEKETIFAEKTMLKQQIVNALPDFKPLHSKNFPQYIVSLTSYGERLSTTAPYAIATIFQQTVLPDKILLWVAYEDEEIALTMLKDVNSILHKLAEKGLEVRYCEDIKSYKKLIPAIENFPEDYIITADDDVFYPQNWLEQLLAEHRKNTNKIICHRAHGIKVDENHNLLPYNEWNSCNPRLENIFPTGVGGILYPPKCFHKGITNKELFMKFAPKNDDIWFWAMAVINKEYFGEENPYIVIENGYSKNLQDIDPEQQQDGKALWAYNCSQGGNDKQLKAVIERYPQIKETLNKYPSRNDIGDVPTTSFADFYIFENKNVVSKV